MGILWQAESSCTEIPMVNTVALSQSLEWLNFLTPITKGKKPTDLRALKLCLVYYTDFSGSVWYLFLLNMSLWYGYKLFR